MTLQRSAIQAQQMALIQQLKSQQTELRQYVQDTWGSKADENMKLVAKGLDFLGLRQYVEQNPLCETPAFAEALLQAGRLMSEDELLSGGASGSREQTAALPEQRVLTMSEPIDAQDLDIVTSAHAAGYGGYQRTRPSAAASATSS
jgi:hypothetical protein